jgi:hypothetical protein
MSDERFDELLRQAARDYHRPPVTPRDEMWAGIVAARAARRRTIPRSLVLRWGVGIAAVLALGVAMGRWSARGSLEHAGVPAASDRPSPLVYQLAAAQYLSRTEALLTGFRSETHAGAPMTQLSAQARDLLCTTRLMLDSPAAKDVRLKSLLEDLEVVLAQIAQLPPRGDREDVRLINQGLEQRSMLLRLRTTSPAGPGSARTQGAL